MIRAGNELMKMVREKLKLNQAQMGEHLHMTQRTVSRIETGKRDLGVWEYFSLMQMAGMPTEDLSPLILESRELKDYNAYRELKKLLMDARFSEAKAILPKFERDLISEQPFILQFVAFAKIYIDEEMPHELAIDGLYGALSMSVKSFDENRLAEYRFTYNEICILTGIAMRLEFLGKLDCAITLYKALVNSRGNALATEEDKAALYPALMFNLSTLLGKSGKYKEALSYCKDAHGISIKYNKLQLVPRILHNMASCYRLIGEEEQIYKTHFIRAYHVAHAVEDSDAIAEIKKDAEKFGISNF